MTPLERLARIEQFEKLLAQYARLLKRGYPVSKDERATAKDAVVNAYAKLVGELDGVRS